MRHKITKF